MSDLWGFGESAELHPHKSIFSEQVRCVIGWERENPAFPLGARCPAQSPYSRVRAERRGAGEGRAREQVGRGLGEERGRSGGLSVGLGAPTVYGCVPVKRCSACSWGLWVATCFLQGWRLSFWHWVGLHFLKLNATSFHKHLRSTWQWQVFMNVMISLGSSLLCSDHVLIYSNWRQ